MKSTLAYEPPRSRPDFTAPPCKPMPWVRAKESRPAPAPKPEPPPTPPAEPQPRLVDKIPANQKPRVPFAVYSKHGVLIARFDDRDIALANLAAWPQAAYVLQGKTIIRQKGGAA